MLRRCLVWLLAFAPIVALAQDARSIAPRTTGSSLRDWLGGGAQLVTVTAKDNVIWGTRNGDDIIRGTDDNNSWGRADFGGGGLL